MQKGMSLFLSYTNMIKHQCKCLIQLLKQIHTSGESLANLCKCLIVFPYPSRLWFTFVLASWIISEFENSWSKWMTLCRKFERWFETSGNLYILPCLFVCLFVLYFQSQLFQIIHSLLVSSESHDACLAFISAALQRNHTKAQLQVSHHVPYCFILLYWLWCSLWTLCTYCCCNNSSVNSYLDSILYNVW